MKRPAGYTGAYPLPAVNGAPGSYVSPTEAAASIQRGNWPVAFTPGTPAGIDAGEIVAVLATGVIDAVNSLIPNALIIASGATLSRTTFSGLFATYNTTFGVGDNSTTFGTIDIPRTHSYLEGTTTSGLSYTSQYRVDSVLPSHTHNVNVGTSTSPGPAPPTNGFIQSYSTYNYTTGLNYNGSPRNEARHRQVIRCIAAKNIPTPPVGSLTYILAPTYLPNQVEPLGLVPAGYLIPSGQLLSRSTYPELFNRIGVKFGSGDGSTTFGVPNLLGLFTRGAEATNYITTSGTDVSSSGYLGDTLIYHTHGKTGVLYNTGGDGFPQRQGVDANTGNVPSSDSSIGSSETRPKNITVFYYLVATGNY